MGPEDELIARYQQVAGPYTRRIRIGVSLFFALIAGIGVSSQWKQWVLFTHTQSFGIKRPAVPQGHRLLRLPAAVPQVHRRLALRRSGDRADRHRGRALPQRRDPVPEPVPAGHAAGEGAPLGDPRGDGAGEDRAVLPRPLRARTSRPGAWSRARATPTCKAQLPALNLLIVISIVAAALFLWNIRRRGWVLPIIAVGLWAFVSLVIGTIYPAVVPAVQGRAERVPGRGAVHRPQHPRDARRVRPRRGRAPRTSTSRRSTQLDPDEATDVVDSNTSTINNARLWDPAIIRATYSYAPEPADLLPDRRRRRRPLPRSTARRGRC